MPSEIRCVGTFFERAVQRLTTYYLMCIRE
jgi:hypothetical protein